MLKRGRSESPVEAFKRSEPAAAPAGVLALPDADAVSRANVLIPQLRLRGLSEVIVGRIDARADWALFGQLPRCSMSQISRMSAVESFARPPTRPM
jgi:hypothetical protein